MGEKRDGLFLRTVELYFLIKDMQEKANLLESELYSAGESLDCKGEPSWNDLLDALKFCLFLAQNIKEKASRLECLFNAYLEEAKKESEEARGE